MPIYNISKFTPCYFQFNTFQLAAFYYANLLYVMEV